MHVDTRVNEALRLDVLDLPPKPRVLSIEATDYVDWSGDPALRILVTIAEDTTDEELMNGKAISQLRNAIHDSLLANGISLFPYSNLAKPSELADDYDDDDEE